jgi:hypothetical protein
MTKDITVDGLQKTTYIKDEMEGKIAVKEESLCREFKEHKMILIDRVNKATNVGCYKKSRNVLRRLNKLVAEIQSYLVAQKFSTRKAFITIMNWVVALYNQDAIYIEDGDYRKTVERLIEFINELQERNLEGFDKVNKSALKHVNKIHKIAQVSGCF